MLHRGDGGGEWQQHRPVLYCVPYGPSPFCACYMLTEASGALLAPLLLLFKRECQRFHPFGS